MLMHHKISSSSGLNSAPWVIRPSVLLPLICEMPFLTSRGHHSFTKGLKTIIFRRTLILMFLPCRTYKFATDVKCVTNKTYDWMKLKSLDNTHIYTKKKNTTQDRFLIIRKKHKSLLNHFTYCKKKNPFLIFYANV